MSPNAGDGPADAQRRSSARLGAPARPLVVHNPAGEVAAISLHASDPPCVAALQRLVAAGIAHAPSVESLLQETPSGHNGRHLTPLDLWVDDMALARTELAILGEAWIRALLQSSSVGPHLREMLGSLAGDGRTAARSPLRDVRCVGV